jgi:hypothetical protein
MAKKEADFFDRLRQAGLRKQVAKALSETGEDAAKKLQRAARKTASELRALADELERRVPPDAPDGSPVSAARRPSRTPRTQPRATAAARRPPRASSTPAPGARAKKPATPRTAKRSPVAKPKP